MFEASQLADWLEAIAAAREAQLEIGFLEPKLSFQVATADGERVVRVHFAIEAHPPWSPESEAPFEEFSVGELDLAGAVRERQEQLRKVPQRAQR